MVEVGLMAWIIWDGSWLEVDDDDERVIRQNGNI